MVDSAGQTADGARALARDRFGDLLGLLRDDGYRLVGPTIRDGAIVYDDIAQVSDLPVGWTDEQAPGRYRLKRRNDAALFGYVVGPHSWKQFLFPPREPLVHIRRDKDAPTWTAAKGDETPLAFVGVRACEVAAISVQDRIFLGGPHVDGHYRGKRDQCFILAINCLEAGSLCFCDSMKTGPRVEGDCDLCATELEDAFVLEARSERGRALLARLAVPAASPAAVGAASDGIEHCRTSMKKRLDTRDLAGRLFANLDHPRWKEVADRCLACGNCTLVCPTCFCFTVEDTSDLAGLDAGRTRRWDSCFSREHSAIHGAEFRPTVELRYRQWLTHKLASWTSQFGTSGCVGCGRCIAWCPVGIDIVAEATAITSGDAAPVPLPAPQTYTPAQKDPLVPIPARVARVHRETADVATLVLEAPPESQGRPGQFSMLSLPGIGEVAISISGAGEGTAEYTIRGVGAVTRALVQQRSGATIGIRGPFGSAWPLDKARGRHVVVIAGGLGIAPLRGALREMVRDPKAYPHVRLMYGARTPEDILFDREILGWILSSHMRAHVTVDRADAAWVGNVGVVTRLLRRKYTPADGLYLVCGPEVMMQFVLRDLAASAIPEENIYVSMERNMKCAAGLCGRCQYGPYFICKDGPVFRYDQLSFLFGRPGF